ncbi:glycoside hydrolase family 26 protein [Aestuariivirga sp.]|uniref:glycoside hydrolase family 26 protein n=1 Tax=Aestuariivirga sp. TaxID=2650926 RepID=UPI003BAB05C7
MNQITKNLIRSILIAGASAAMGFSLALGNASDSNPDEGHSFSKRLVVTQDSISFGAYDPYGDFSSASKASIEHIFLPWEDVDLSDLQAADAYALARGRKLMVTVEPWSWSADSRIRPAALLDGILAGRYDANITAVCSAISRLKSPISIRWGQEMEDPSTIFPWSHWSPKEFIAAYQRFVTECRKHAPDAKYVWSPKGNKELVDYYPGDQYVDEIGLSVFGYQPYDEINFGGDRTFAQALEQGYRLAEGFGKPIIVAELGYEGSPDYVTRWAKDVTTPHIEFPRLVAVVYFNTRETNPWPRNMGRPNWRIGPPATVGP